MNLKLKETRCFMSGTLKSVHANAQEIKDHIQLDEIRFCAKEN